MNEDNNFLNSIDQGYVGLHKAQVQRIADPFEHIPGWYRHKLSKSAWEEGLLLEDLMDKYHLTGDPKDDLDYLPWDDGNWPNDEAA